MKISALTIRLWYTYFTT